MLLELPATKHGENWAMLPMLGRATVRLRRRLLNVGRRQRQERWKRAAVKFVIARISTTGPTGCDDCCL